MAFIVTAHCPAAFKRFQSGHNPLQVDDYDIGVQRVMMLRKPALRATSGFFAGLHSCKRMQTRHGVRCAGPTPGPLCQPEAPPPGSFYATFTDDAVREYAECISACAANMIMGRTCDASSANVDVQKAVQRLQSFEFVGIQDDWNNTIKAFGRKYSVPLKATDYQVLRPGLVPQAYSRVRTSMQAFSFSDEPVYSAGLQHLQTTVRRYLDPHDASHEMVL